MRRRGSKANNRDAAYWGAATSHVRARFSRASSSRLSEGNRQGIAGEPHPPDHCDSPESRVRDPPESGPEPWTIPARPDAAPAKSGEMARPCTSTSRHLPRQRGSRRNQNPSSGRAGRAETGSVQQTASPACAGKSTVIAEPSGGSHKEPRAHSARDLEVHLDAGHVRAVQFELIRFPARRSPGT